MSQSNVKTIKFADALQIMEPADLLLYRGTSYASQAIRLASLSPYSHASMVAFRTDDTDKSVPILIEVLQWWGGRDLDLQQEVERHPGGYELRKANADNRWPEFNRRRAVERMYQFRGTTYGWGRIGLASLAFLPIVRLFQKVDAFLVDDEASLKTPPFCSMAYAIACDHGGVDPVDDLKHSMTTPGHLAQSKFFKKVGALVP